jgi:hypothetical protein
MWYILDENNNPVPVNDTYEYFSWLDEDETRKVVKQEVVNGKYVSTVFLGMDHNYHNFGSPILFETMVFPEKGNFSEIYCERCCFYDDALMMHQEAIQWVRKGGQ